MKSPIKQFSGLKVRISQKFGANPSYYAKYKDDSGNPLKGHNGLDLVIGYDSQKMYGADLFSPCKGKVIQVVWTNPMSSKGNGIYIESEHYFGSDGQERYDLWVMWHMMHVDVAIGQELSEGQYIGDMGNSGEVFPVPTANNVYAGTHLHIAKYPYIKTNLGWHKDVPNNGYGGATDPELSLGDLNPAGWVRKNNNFEWISEVLEPIKHFIKYIQDLIKGRK